MANEIGRPEYTDPQYEIWLEELRPFLQQGKSLYRAIELSGLLSKQTTLYNKYRLKDWFLQKVDAYRSEFGEMINDTMYSLVVKIKDKVKRHEDLTDQESKLLMFNAEKHRSAQPYFVNRFETAKGKPIEEIVDDLNNETDNIDDVAENIKRIAGTNGEQQQQIAPTAAEQVVAPNPPIQDQGQAGTDSNIPAQPDAGQTPPGSQPA